MDSLLKSDIFFFISSLAAVLITVIVVVIGLRVLPIIRDIRSIVSTFKEEGEKVVKDIDHLRTSVKEKSASTKGVLAIISSLFSIKKKARRSKRKVEDNES